MIRARDRTVPAPNASARRGLAEIVRLAWADFECGVSDQTPRWNARERRELEDAFNWLRTVALR